LFDRDAGMAVEGFVREQEANLVQPCPHELFVTVAVPGLQQVDALHADEVAQGVLSRPLL
jgi:hypothetical protein